jgi:aryl-alcohol dehydrogenase-like predicted oxidoreductase
MQYRRLGKTDLKVSDVGYGAWGIGGKQWLGGTDEESKTAVRRAFELGMNFVDTALAYGDGHSERLLAGLLREAPGEVLIATKIPPKNRIWPATADYDAVYPQGYCEACTDESLRNLDIERIDVQQFHVWHEGFAERDEWKRVAEDLKRSGKVRFIGISVSEHEPDTVLAALETGLIDTVQVIYNIFDQSPKRNLFPACQRLDVGVIARVPFDEGGLTGTIDEGSTFEGDEFRANYFRGDRKREIRERVERLQAALEGVEGTLPEIALRFCLSHEAVHTVIPGMRRARNVEANCVASDKGWLPAEILAELERHEWLRNFYQ